MDGWMDGQKHITKLTIAFCNFVNVPKNLYQKNNFFHTKKIILLIILKVVAEAAAVTITSL